MAKYPLSNKAVSDLSQIWNYTYETWSENQADNYYSFLISTFESIALNPNLGKSYDVIALKLLGLLAKRHIIFYRKMDNGSIEIIRILHSSMDLKNRMVE